RCRATHSWAGDKPMSVASRAALPGFDSVHRPRRVESALERTDQPMGSVRIQPSGGWRPATGTQAGTGLGPLHAIVDYAHELADAQHKVLDRIANLGVRARLGDVYRRFVRALASFERALAKAGWAPSGIHADRLD